MPAQRPQKLVFETLESRRLFANLAPVLQIDGTPKLSTIPKNDTDNSGTAIFDILRRHSVKNDSPIADPDVGAVQGIAVVAADTTHGQWDFSLDHGQTWQDLGPVSGYSSRLLAVDSTARLRFRPDDGFVGLLENAIHFRAWDQSQGESGALYSIAEVGGASPFSTDVEQAQIRVDAMPDVVRGWGLVGDSNGFGYQFKPQRATDRQWVEQLDAERGLYFGEFQVGSWGAGRDQGREFLWGGSRPDLGLDPVAFDGLLQQVRNGQVTVALYAWGSLNLFARVNDIYSGTLSGKTLETFVDQVVNEVAGDLRRLTEAGDAKVIVQGFGDALAAPWFYLNPAFSNAVGRQRMTDAVSMANRKLETVADTLRIPVAKFHEISKLAVQPTPVIVGGVTLDQTAIRAFQDNPTDFFSDGLHTGTIIMGLHANMMLTALNRAYDTQIPLLSDQEILRNAGLATSEQIPTFFDLSSYVHYDEPLQVVDDSWEVDEGQVGQFDVLANDVDPEQASIQLVGWTQPMHGTLEQDELGKLVYTPQPGYEGRDAFHYWASDNPARSEMGEVSIIVRNVAPRVDSLTAMSTEPVNGSSLQIRGSQSTPLRGRIVDPGLLDSHLVSIYWGDGTSSLAQVDPVQRTFTATHSYRVGGIYRVAVTVSDDSGAEGTGQTSLAISGSRTTEGQLQVVGSDVADRIQIERDGSKVRVRNGNVTVLSVDRSAVREVWAWLGGGHDWLTLNDMQQEATIDAGNGNDRIWGGDENDIIFGGEGDDWIDGGQGNNVLVGGAGDDWLVTGSGRDVLVGGHGKDVLLAGSGDDLLIAGRVAFEEQILAWIAVRSEWTTLQSIDSRMTRLQDSRSVVALKAGLTVFDDRDTDILSDGAGQDWFFANTGRMADSDLLYWFDPRYDRLTRI